MRHLLRTTRQNLYAAHVTAQYATFAVVLLSALLLLATAREQIAAQQQM